MTDIKHLIPHLDKPFYNCKLAGMDCFELLDKSQLNQINLKLQGPTGAGKTIIYEAFCEKTNQPHFFSNMKGSTTSEELVGAFVPNESETGGRYVWKDGVIIRALRYSSSYKLVGGNDLPNGMENYVITEEKEDGKFKAFPRCMLTIEEINFSPEELMSVWFSLLDDRRNIVLNEKDGEVIHAGPFLTVNATMNPDYIGTNPLNEALNDRFLLKLNVDYDPIIENKIINDKVKEYQFGLDEIKFLKSFIKLIRKGKFEGECKSNISTRMIEAYLEIKGQFGDEVSKQSIFNSFDDEDQAFVGQTYALAHSKSNTIKLSQAELEGLDLEQFKSFNPTNTSSVKAKRTKKAKMPF
jgi:MoxR-like ATPase